MGPMVRRAWLGSLAGAGLATALFSIFLILRAGFDLSAPFTNWDQVVLVAVLGGGLTALAFAAAYLRYQNAMRGLGDQLAEFRHKPTQLIKQVLAAPTAAVELEPLLTPIESLCEAYRKVLKERVRLGESLSSLRMLVGGDGTRPAGNMQVLRRRRG